jgi:hypothetical protein
MFADLFPSGRGRPSLPAPVVASALVLQALHGLSDREAAEAVTCDLRWKAAVGLLVTAPAFHPTTLTYWRARLAGSERPNRVFEAVRELFGQTGTSSGSGRRLGWLRLGPEAGSADARVCGPLTSSGRPAHAGER